MDITGYRVGDTLGAGAFGTVYSAVAISTGLDVAIKVLENPGEYAHRFRREIQALVTLAWHPYIVRVIDAGELADGRLWFSMERLGPPPARDKRHTADRVADIGIQLAGALSAAHGAGLIHRDVKPGNVLTGTGGFVKLADFGIAADLSGSNTSLAAAMGTYQFMAPELLDEDELASETSDQYSLGATLCALAVGRLPFGDPNTALSLGGLRRAKREPQHRALRSTALPPALIAAIEQAMNHDPSQRFASLDDFAAEITGLQRYSAWPVTRYVTSRDSTDSPTRPVVATPVGSFGSAPPLPLPTVNAGGNQPTVPRQAGHQIPAAPSPPQLTGMVPARNVDVAAAVGGRTMTLLRRRPLVAAVGAAAVGIFAFSTLGSNSDKLPAAATTKRQAAGSVVASTAAPTTTTSAASTTAVPSTTIRLGTTAATATTQAAAAPKAATSSTAPPARPINDVPGQPMTFGSPVKARLTSGLAVYRADGKKGVPVQVNIATDSKMGHVKFFGPATVSIPATNPLEDRYIRDGPGFNWTPKEDGVFYVVLSLEYSDPADYTISIQELSKVG